MSCVLCVFAFGKSVVFQTLFRFVKVFFVGVCKHLVVALFFAVRFGLGKGVGTVDFPPVKQAYFHGVFRAEVSATHAHQAFSAKAKLALFCDANVVSGAIVDAHVAMYTFL